MIIYDCIRLFILNRQCDTTMVSFESHYTEEGRKKSKKTKYSGREMGLKDPWPYHKGCKMKKKK